MATCTRQARSTRSGGSARTLTTRSGASRSAPSTRPCSSTWVDMSDLAVGTDDDLLLLEGRAQIVQGAAAVRQAWITHLTLFLGECFRDRSLGIDYQNQILDKSPSSTVLRAIYARA